MITASVDSSWRVRVRYRAELPIPKTAAWETLRDFRRIVCLDHFHSDCRLHAPGPAPGVTFDLPHRALGRHFDRWGRILRWNEGTGYSFSDLSRASPHDLFPHVFSLELRSSPTPSATPRSSCFELQVRGAWTDRWLPRWSVRLWVLWNVWAMGVAIGNALLLTAWHQQAGGGPKRLPTRQRSRPTA